MDVRLKPPIDPEQTPKPTQKESPEAFVFLSDPTWATRDEPCLLLVSHGDEVRQFAAPVLWIPEVRRDNWRVGPHTGNTEGARKTSGGRRRGCRACAPDLSIRGDDPELASYLRIEERELEAGGLN